MDPNEVTKIGQWLQHHVRNRGGGAQGKVHDYLGMMLNFTFEGHIIINMAEYTGTIIADFPEEITGVRTTPAADHLFDVRDEADAHLLLPGARGTGSGFPPRCGAGALPQRESSARHTAGDGVPDNEGKEPGQR